MDIKDFERTWETEYICARVRLITEAVKNGNYNAALDILEMLKYKANAAGRIIKQESK